MPAVRTDWTVEMLDDLPDDCNRYELIDGDYQIKRRLYLASGIPEYWIVSPDTRTIARWRGPRGGWRPAHDAARVATSRNA